jgi:prepilin-type N-terminal cleavage/methylation domain-containing protein
MRKMRGFTLIEMLGVLAIIAILSAIFIPNLITRTEGFSLNAEQQSLKALASSLEDFVVTTRSIPSQGAAGNWAWAIGSQSAISVPQILTNKLGVQRQFIIDPAFVAQLSLLFPAEFPGAPVVPVGAPAGTPASLYTQGATALGGAVPVTTPNTVIPPLRVIIASDLRKSGANGVAPVPLPALVTAAAFDAVWNQQLPIGDPWREKVGITNAAGAVVDSDVSTGVVIQRVNLAHLFHRVTIKSAYTGPPLPLASYQIENFPPQQVLPVNTVPPVGPDRFYEILVVHGTRISFITSPDAAGVTSLAFVQIIKGPESFDYPKFEIFPQTVPPTPATFKWTR